MSLPTKKDVPQLIEKYRREHPNIDRDLTRKLIRLENNITNPSELKKLDRYLRKAFKNEVKPIAEKQRTIREDYFLELKTIAQLTAVNPNLAWGRLNVFIACLPQEERNKINVRDIAESTLPERAALLFSVRRIRDILDGKEPEKLHLQKNPLL